MKAEMLLMLSPNSIKHVQVIYIFNSQMDYYFNTLKSLHPLMPHHLINGSYIMISFIVLPQSSFIYIDSFTIFISIHAVHLNRVYDKAKFCTGGWGKPILIYHMIDRLGLISTFNDNKR